MKTIEEFINAYPHITNGDMFSFIQKYDECLFFIKLFSCIKRGEDDSWKSLYIDISVSYFMIKKYFEEH